MHTDYYKTSFKQRVEPLQGTRHGLSLKDTSLNTAGSSPCGVYNLVDEGITQ